MHFVRQAKTLHILPNTNFLWFHRSSFTPACCLKSWNYLLESADINCSESDNEWLCCNFDCSVVTPTIDDQLPASAVDSRQTTALHGAQKTKVTDWWSVCMLAQICCLLVICSTYWVPRPGSKIHYPVPNPGNWYPFLYWLRYWWNRKMQFGPVFSSAQCLYVIRWSTSL